MRLMIIFFILLAIFIKVVLESDTFQLVSVQKEDGLYTTSRFEWHWDNFTRYMDAKYFKIEKIFFK